MSLPLTTCLEQLWTAWSLESLSPCTGTLLSPHLETMPCWVWQHVCGGGNAAASTFLSHPHPTPPHPTSPRIWRRCHVECGRKCVKGRNAPPGRYCPPRIWRRCHVECGRKCVKGRNAAARTLFSHPTPPNPTPPRLERMPCWLWLQVWRGFWFLNRVDGGRGIVFFWLRNRVFWFRNRLFWLRNRLFLVAESSFFWLRKRLFLVSEA